MRTGSTLVPNRPLTAERPPPMYPFWEPVVAPLVKAANARRIVEIGALRGETTVQMLDELGPEAELHVIDPVPEFDPDEHARRFPGRYLFHRDLSLNALPEIGAVDVALIDGDHNWYTVYNELRLIREASRREQRPLPLLILHDVGWPYGRRDLYYDPSNIPETERQPFDYRGMRPGRAALLPAGGMNITLANALNEGGERNGVRTGLDDFVAEHDRPLRQIVIPIYYGLAVLAEEELLDERPELTAILDQLESPEGTSELLELSERIRLDEVVFQHNVMRMNAGRLEEANGRYLRLLRDALLDRHYIDNELRIEHLLLQAASNRPPDLATLANPAGVTRHRLRMIEQARRSSPSDATDEPLGYFPYASMGSVRLDHLDESIRTVLDGGVDGDLVDCGCGRGGAAIYMRGVLAARDVPGRQVWVADEFRSMRTASPRSVTDGGLGDVGAELNQVRDGFDRFDLLDERVRFLQGRFDQTLPDAPIESIALLRIGADAGTEVTAILDELHPRLTPGGVVIIENASDPAVRSAVDEFRARHGLGEVEDRIGWGGASWRKPYGADPKTTVPATSVVRDRAPLAPPQPDDSVDLSVVVVFHAMEREAERTLHSLSRAYQLDIDDLSYEVIAVDNGSPAGNRLSRDFVEGFGAEFRLLDMGDDAPPSPTVALNRGIAESRGSAVALMIDGAHVLSPRVLALGMKGLDTYAPAVVAAQQWYVGPGQQPEMVDAGYDQAAEDSLFDSINWPVDGYLLFNISHFIGDRDWFDGVVESNCLFAPRDLLEQVGGFDESFSVPGGGYANLDLYERLGATPGVTVASLLGEGTFHQVHGGTTTNDGERDDRRAKLVGYGDDYEAARGHRLRGLGKPMHFVGALATAGATRTRPRRLTAPGLAGFRSLGTVDGPPTEAAIIPDDLRSAMIEATWDSFAWGAATWLGHPFTGTPNDLMIYQELVSRIRPDHIVVTGDHGRARFLSSICRLLGHGEVIAVGSDGDPEDRLTHVSRAPHTSGAAERVNEIVGADPNALVVIGSDNNVGLLVAEFENYCGLVRPGSYVIMENTVRNGRPVWPGHGPGPFEAVRRILGGHGEFVQDTTLERYIVTFNPGGFLRRVA